MGRAIARAGLGAGSVDSGDDRGAGSAAEIGHDAATAGDCLVACSVGDSFDGSAISSGGGHHACHPVLGVHPDLVVACLVIAGWLVPAEEGGAVACSGIET